MDRSISLDLVREKILRDIIHYDICRNLPFGGRAMRGSRVRLPWEEGTRSRHQRLFEENVGKTGKDVVYEL